MRKKVAVLFAMKKSVYNQFKNVEVYDIERNALTFSGNVPVVCHPPCRAWGKLKYFSKHEPEEKKLAIFAVDQVRKNGGVLEHPAYSSLWKELKLPLANETDEHGGFTLSINQSWFGHQAEKKTWLYICGILKKDVPSIPLSFNAIEYVISTSKRKSGHTLKECSKKQREATPVELARWLLRMAQRCKMQTI